jgi:hypothetical protein
MAESRVGLSRYEDLIFIDTFIPPVRAIKAPHSLAQASKTCRQAGKY